MNVLSKFDYSHKSLYRLCLAELIKKKALDIYNSQFMLFYGHEVWAYDDIIKYLTTEREYRYYN